MGKETVSLVLTYLGDPPTFPKCLRAIEAQTEAPIEVLRVRGDGIASETEDIVKCFKAAHGDRIATTNADCYLPPDFVERLGRWLDAGFDMASGVRVPSHFGAPNWISYDLSPGSGVSGSGLLFRRSLLARGPPFRFKTGWDVELALKARAQFVIDPSVRVFHDDRHGNLRLAKKALQYVRRNGAMALMYGGLSQINPVPPRWRGQ